MKKALFIILAMILANPVSAQAEETVFARVMKAKEIKCGYIIAPPYIIKDPNTGKMSGLNYEMVEAVGRNLGLKINWATEVGVGDVAASLAANKFDVMCQTLWPSAARFSGVTFMNRPQFYSAIYAAVRADDKRFDGDLKKADKPSVTATAFEGDFSADLVAEKMPQAKRHLLSASSSLADYLMQLTTKKADILFIDKGTLTDFSKNSPGQIKLVENVPPARTYGEHLAVKPGEYQLRDMIDMATLQLVNDGVFEEIVKRYAKEYGTDIYAARKDIAK